MWWPPVLNHWKHQWIIHSGPLLHTPPANDLVDNFNYKITNFTDAITPTKVKWENFWKLDKLSLPPYQAVPSLPLVTNSISILSAIQSWRKLCNIWKPSYTNYKKIFLLQGIGYPANILLYSLFPLWDISPQALKTSAVPNAIFGASTEWARVELARWFLYVQVLRLLRHHRWATFLTLHQSFASFSVQSSSFKYWFGCLLPWQQYQLWGIWISCPENYS